MSDKYLPRYSAETYYSDTPDDKTFAEAFALLANFLESVDDEDPVCLWISTCRNAFLTINALFVDLRDAIGHGNLPSSLSRGLAHIAKKNFQPMETQLSDAALALDQFDKKLNSWNRRGEFRAILAEYLASLKHSDRAILERVLFRVKTKLEEGLEWPLEYVALDESSHPRLSTLWDILVEVKSVLYATLIVARNLSTLGAALALLLQTESADKEQNLFEMADRQPATQAGTTLISELRIYSPKLGLDTSKTKLALAVLTEFNESNSSSEAALDAVAQIGEELQRVVNEQYLLLKGTFRPNVAAPPLPNVFVVDLRDVPRTISDSKRNSVPLTVQNFGCDRPAMIRIAIPNLHLPNDCFRLDKYGYHTEQHRLAVSKAAREAIDAASEGGANLIVFPELFLPEDHRLAVMQTATERNLAIISGVEASWDPFNGSYSSMASIQFPRSEKQHLQFKHKPSNEEPQNLVTKGGQLIFQNSEIGTFSVILCSDYREYDVIHAIEAADQYVDFIVVCCMNSHSSLWSSIAIGDAQRLYSFVVLVNCDFPSMRIGASVGSGVIQPSKDPNNAQIGSVKTIALHKGHQAGQEDSVDIFELHLDWLVRRHPRPHNHFAAPPHRRLFPGSTNYS